MKHTCKRELWDKLKENCMLKAQEYSCKRAGDKRELLQNLYKLSNVLTEESMHKEPNQEMIKEINRKIDEIELERVQGCIFRSRCTWAKFGEKPTKYFFALEKCNYNSKTMFSVFDEKGKLCKDQRTILLEQWRFYDKLYSSDENVEFSMVNTSNNKLDVVQKMYLDSDITISEIEDAIRDSKCNKVAGCDGLLIEFYDKFSQLLVKPMYEMFLEVLENGKMTRSMRRGLMSLIPKKNQDTRYIKNLRSITLLNCDYKILAKIFATCLKTVLPEIIDLCQTGFMEGRHLHDNVRKTMDIITYLYQNNKKAVVISLDFEKCFDRIEHRSIYGALDFYGFGNKFISWIKVFFTKFVVFTQNGRKVSPPINKGRGVNQGCPISPFLWNVIGQTLAQRIKENKNIKSVKIDKSEVENVISQFTDDTALFLIYEETCINSAISELMYIERNTGVKVSYEKSCIYRVGSLKGSNVKMYTLKNIQWSDGDIEMLGVRIRNDARQELKQLEEIIVKMQNILQVWTSRMLTLMGKILLINSLVFSLFVHTMFVLPPINEVQIKTVERNVETFLWGKKKPKIPLKILYRKKTDGGLKLMNMIICQKALQMSWVEKAHLPEWEYIYYWLDKEIKALIWEVNLHKDETKYVNTCESFWRQVLSNWCEVHHCNPQNSSTILNQVIWYNSHIRVNGCPITPHRDFVHKVMYLKDLINDDNQWMNFDKLCMRYVIKRTTANWLWYVSVLSAIPSYWKFMIHRDKSDTKFIEEPHLDVKDLCSKNCSVSSIVYEFYMHNLNTRDIYVYAKRWFKKMGIIEFCLEEYLVCFKDLYKVVEETRLRNFQYKLLLGKVFCNDMLYKWKIVKSEVCEFCKKEKQTVVHLLVNCQKAKNIWLFFQEKIPNPNKCLTWETHAIMQNHVHPKP